MSPATYRHASSSGYAAAMAAIALLPTLGKPVVFVVVALGLAIVVGIPLLDRRIRERFAGPGLRAGDGLLLPAAVAIAASFIAGSDPGIWNVLLGALTLVIAYLMGLSFWRQALERAATARAEGGGDAE
ncbi:hypothetical protein [Zhihengliuella sp.]|uniref:hypothetical protein n=1 Tax=Zhihengliuella sp. TaxID=1954483 RepID=UPI00281136E7|nr:hypothetical protein [Zhihengliuella sp.]